MQYGSAKCPLSNLMESDLQEIGKRSPARQTVARVIGESRDSG